MKEIEGNIWDYNKDNYVIITTNGTLTPQGACVMGAGVALQAKEKYPKLPFELGEKIKKTGNFSYIFPQYKIITCPVKRNYWDKADIELICYHLQCVSDWIKVPSESWAIHNSWINNAILPVKPIKKVFLPRPVCQNGRLNWGDVRPKIKNLLDDRFIVVSNINID